MKLVCTDVLNTGNLLLYPRMETDSDGDGMVDGFTSYANATVRQDATTRNAIERGLV